MTKARTLGVMIAALTTLLVGILDLTIVSTSAIPIARSLAPAGGAACTCFGKRIAHECRLTSSRLLQTRERNLNIGIRLDGAINKRIKLGILERAPPLRKINRCAPRCRRCRRRRRHEFLRCRRVWRMIVRPDGAACKPGVKQAQTQDFECCT